MQYATMAQLEQILQHQKEVAEAEASALDAEGYPEGMVAAGEKEGRARGAKKRKKGKKGKKQTGHRRP